LWFEHTCICGSRARLKSWAKNTFLSYLMMFLNCMVLSYQMVELCLDEFKII
jgi:hypothetical protein